jgi:hypothetical protein
MAGADVLSGRPAEWPALELLVGVRASAEAVDIAAALGAAVGVAAVAAAPAAADACRRCPRRR